MKAKKSEARLRARNLDTDDSELAVDSQLRRTGQNVCSARLRSRGRQMLTVFLELRV